jgi:hypothetical protein
VKDDVEEQKTHFVGLQTPLQQNFVTNRVRLRGEGERVYVRRNVDRPLAIRRLFGPDCVNIDDDLLVAGAGPVPGDETSDPATSGRKLIPRPGFN